MKQAIIIAFLLVFSFCNFAQKKASTANINYAETINIGDKGVSVDTAKKAEQVKKDTLPTYNIYQLTVDEKGWKLLLHVLSEADEKPSDLREYIGALNQSVRVYVINPNQQPKTETPPVNKKQH